MKYLIVVLFVLLLACEDANDLYCWECTKAVRISQVNPEPFVAPITFSADTILCDKSLTEILIYEKAGKDSFVIVEEGISKLYEKTFTCNLL